MKQILGSLTNDSFGRGEASSERKITWFQIYSLPVDKGLKQVKQLVQQQKILALHTQTHASTASGEGERKVCACVHKIQTARRVDKRRECKKVILH